MIFSDRLSQIAALLLGSDYRIPTDQVFRPYTYPVSRKPYGVVKVRRQARKLRNKRRR